METTTTALVGVVHNLPISRGIELHNGLIKEATITLDGLKRFSRTDLFLRRASSSGEWGMPNAVICGTTCWEGRMYDIKVTINTYYRDSAHGSFKMELIDERGLGKEKV